MAIVWSHCKTKTICEADDPKEDGENPEGEEPKKGHGGCGHAQPQIRKEGLKLFVQYKRRKDDDEVCGPSPFYSDMRLPGCIYRIQSRPSLTRDYSLRPMYTRR